MKYGKLIRELARRNPVIILIGQSGGGKNTLAQPLIESGLFFHSETGQLFRNSISKFTERNRRLLQKINDSGSRQSWSIATSLWVKNILDRYEGGPIIIDGSPRTKEEARAVLDFFGKGFLGRDILLFHLKLSDATAEQRMIRRNDEMKKAGGTVRKDTSTKKSRMKKLKFFHTDVLPAIMYMKNKGVAFYNIDCEVSIEKVREQFFVFVEKYLNKKSKAV